MKFYKKLIGMLVAVMMMFAMAACGGGSENGETPTDAAQTPEQIIEAAEAKMQEVSSLESEMTMNMGMSMGEESLNMKTKMDVVTFTDPVKLKMSMIIDMGEELGGTQKMEMYADEVDGNTTMYMNLMDTWYKQVVPAEQLAEYDTQESLVTYLDGSSDLKEVGTEQVNGEDATRYDGVVSEAAVEEILETSGTLNQLESLLAGTDLEAADLYKDLDDIIVSVWVNAEGYPVKYEMDMKAMMQGLATKVMEANGATEAQMLSIDDLKVSITSKNFNNATDFEIPEAAKNAIEMQQ